MHCNQVLQTSLKNRFWGRGGAAVHRLVTSLCEALETRLAHSVDYYSCRSLSPNVRCLFIVVMHLATLASSQACHSNWGKQIFQMNITGLEIPTGGRQTSWLFTNMTEELNWGPPRNNSSLVVRAGLEPATSGFQVRRPNHSATLPPRGYSRLL